MSKFDDHPTVKRLRQQRNEGLSPTSERSLSAAWLRQVCLDLGADDVGFVSIDQPEMADQRSEILALFPAARSAISFVCRMGRENVRSPARSIANLEFHHAGEQINDVARQIVRTLEERGIRAINPAMGFPMEAQNIGNGKPWVISHKPVAVAAGLGQMGIHRNVIHPKFGNFILLGTILLDGEITEYHQPIEYNPCVECKLCVAACPVGAIGSDGSFNFSACYTHNYREFLGGFGDWAKSVVESRNAQDYDQKVGDGDSASLWQSLSYGANYKAAYCMASCPAGEDVLRPFIEDRKGFVQEVVKPLQDREETVYVVPESDAEAHVSRRFPHKTIKSVRNTLTPNSIGGFVFGLPLVFQPKQAKDLNAVYHFTFVGQEYRQITVSIHDQTCEIQEGCVGRPDLQVRADSQAWIRFLRKESSIVWPLLFRKIQLQGDPRLLLRFGKCFLG